MPGYRMLSFVAQMHVPVCVPQQYTGSVHGRCQAMKLPVPEWVQGGASLTCIS